MSPSNDAPMALALEIFGRTYTLRVQNDQKSKEYVQNLGRIVHDKMVAVDQNTNTVDSLRVAVLAALNIADEYLSLKEACELQIAELEAERARLASLIQGALKNEHQENPA